MIGGEDSGRVGGSQACLVPQIQDNYEIILNTPVTDLKTGRTNSTTKGREKPSLKKVGNVHTWFGRETGHCGGEEALVTEKGERQTNTQDNA